jgi:toluene monooxygenase electron transfer component
VKITVSKKEIEYKFEANSGERVLYAGLRQGLGLPHECATGTCGSCKARLKSGELKQLWPDAPGAKSCKSSKNEFLMCQNTAQSDCEVSFRGKLADQLESGYLPNYYEGRVVDANYLTADVIRILVEFEQVVPFRAGQFVVVNVEGLEGGRAYSMVNCAGGTTLEFIVKQLPEGGFSSWLFDSPRLNSKLSIFGALGNATLGADEGKDILCITGGSGIAGIIALLTQAVDDNYFDKNTGHLFFGIKAEQDLFFRDRLVALVEKSNRKLQVTITFSMGDIPKFDYAGKEDINYLSGNVTPVAMQQMSGQLQDNLVFLAGPPGMVDDAIRRLVIDAAFPVHNIRYDKFG